MNNFELWRLVNFVADKDIHANRIGGEQFDIELKAKSMRLFRKKLGFPESYLPGQPSPIVLDATRLEQTDLRPFYVDKDFTSVAGEVTIPNWFYIEDFITASSRSAEIISRQEISNRLRDAQLKPTEKDVVAYLTASGLRVYPESIEKVHVWYIREPRQPMFTIKTGADLEPEYDEANSIEMEWDDMNKLEVAHMILADMGIVTNRNELVQYAEQLTKTGS